MNFPDRDERKIVVHVYTEVNFCTNFVIHYAKQIDGSVNTCMDFYTMCTSYVLLKKLNTSFTTRGRSFIICRRCLTIVVGKMVWRNRCFAAARSVQNSTFFDVALHWLTDIEKRGIICCLLK